MGQPIYINVDADVANGIMLMNGSGGGQEEGGYWLNWTAAGFTGIAWYWGDTPLPTWWSTVYMGGNEFVTGTEYTNDESGFSSWITAEDPANLNAALSGWTDEAKLAFLREHTDIFASPACVSP